MTETIIAAATALASILISYGVYKSKIETLEQRLKDGTKNQDEIQKQIYNLRDLYITHQHFTDVITSMREDHKELKSDVKTILSMLRAKPTRSR